MFDWYRSLKSHERVVFNAIFGAFFFFTMLFMIYFVTPSWGWSLNPIEWFALTWAVVPSVMAFYYALRAYYSVHKLGLLAGTGCGNPPKGLRKK